MSTISFGIGGNRTGQAPAPDNVIYVNQESDFGTVSAGSHIDALVGDVRFILINPVTQTLPLVIANGSSVEIWTSNRRANVLTYTGTGAQFQGVNASLTLFDVVLSGDGTNTLFDLDGGIFSFKFPDFVNYSSLGMIDNADDVYMPGVFMDLIDDGLTVSNASSLTATENLIDVSNNTFSVFNIVGVSTGVIQIFDAALKNNINASLIDVDSATFPATGRVTIGRNRSDMANKLFAAGSLNESDPRILTFGNQEAKDSIYFGGYFDNTNATITTIAVQDVFQDIVVSATASPEIERFALTDAVTGELTYTGLETFRGALTAEIAAFKSTSTELYSFAVAVNGTSLTDRQVAPLEVKTTRDSISLTVTVELNTNDTIKLQIRADGHTDSLTIDAVNVAVR